MHILFSCQLEVSGRDPGRGKKGAEAEGKKGLRPVVEIRPETMIIKGQFSSVKKMCLPEGENCIPSMMFAVLLSTSAELPVETENPDMTCGASRIGGKGLVAVMAGTAIFAPVQGLHDECILVLFGGADVHREQIAVAVAAAVSQGVNMHGVIENDGLERPGENDLPRRGVAGGAILVGVGVKSRVAVMAGSAILALGKPLHGKVIHRLGGAGLHLE